MPPRIVQAVRCAQASRDGDGFPPQLRLLAGSGSLTLLLWGEPRDVATNGRHPDCVAGWLWHQPASRANAAARAGVRGKPSGAVRLTPTRGLHHGIQSGLCPARGWISKGVFLAL